MSSVVKALGYKFFEFIIINGIMLYKKFIGGALLETIGKSSCT